VVRSRGWPPRWRTSASWHRLRHVTSVPALIEDVLSRRLLRATAYDDWRPREAHRRYRFVAEAGAGPGPRRAQHPARHRGPPERLARNASYDSVAVETSPDEHAVRVMTVHAAKGLEFPIVIVTGWGESRSRDAPDRHRPPLGSVELHVGEFATEGREALDVRESAMEAAERVRLLYVALTRARGPPGGRALPRGQGGDDTDAGAARSAAARV